MLSFADNSLSCVRGSFLKSFSQITVIGKRSKLKTVMEIFKCSTSGKSIRILGSPQEFH